MNVPIRHLEWPNTAIYYDSHFVELALIIGDSFSPKAFRNDGQSSGKD